MRGRRWVRFKNLAGLIAADRFFFDDQSRLAPPMLSQSLMVYVWVRVTLNSGVRRLLAKERGTVTSTLQFSEWQTEFRVMGVSTMTVTGTSTSV
jgi:hypothetical protein